MPNNFTRFMQDSVRECKLGHAWIPVTTKQPKGCPVCKRIAEQGQR